MDYSEICPLFKYLRSHNYTFNTLNHLKIIINQDLNNPKTSMKNNVLVS